MCQYCTPMQCYTCGSLLCEECYQCASEGHNKECSRYIRPEVIAFLEKSLKERPDIWRILAEL